jgi:DNA-binding phage protein
MPKETELKTAAFSTDELFTLIQETRSLESFLDTAGASVPPLNTQTYLMQMLREHKLTKRAVIQEAGLERSTGYMIFLGKRNPKRNTLLSLALAMRLTLQETQRLLKIAQRGELYPKNRRDAAIVYCIHHHLKPIDAGILLDQIGEEPLI